MTTNELEESCLALSFAVSMIPMTKLVCRSARMIAFQLQVFKSRLEALTFGGGVVNRSSTLVVSYYDTLRTCILFRIYVSTKDYKHKSV